jgi:hypothetical protein
MLIAIAKEWSPPFESRSIREEYVDWESPCSPGQRDAKFTRMPSQGSPAENQSKSQKKQTHRRSFSAPYGMEQYDRLEQSILKQANSTKQIEKRGHRRCGSGSLVRVESFGLVDQEQPSLLDPAGRRRRTLSDFEESDVPFLV